MTLLSATTGFPHCKTVNAHFEDTVCHLQFNRPDANNAINAQLVAECSEVLTVCEEKASVIVLSGLPEHFCVGADFREVIEGAEAPSEAFEGPAPMYDLWLRLATGPFVVISYVRGKANAGGLGFIGASDIVLADESAQFSLSEMLFGLYPACVLPFLVRRVGFQRANYLTLSTQSISARLAQDWGLVDVCEAQGEPLLRRHVIRLRRLSRAAVARYKSYAARVDGRLDEFRAAAIAGNLEVFGDAVNQRAIERYVKQGLFPWES